MRDHHRDAAEPADQAAPHVRAELVRVEDIDALPAQEARERPERREVEAPAALEGEPAHACALQLGHELAVSDVGRAQRHLEAVARQRARHAHGEPLRTPDAIAHLVHEDEHVRPPVSAH
jgi:hypothetical protein